MSRPFYLVICLWLFSPLAAAQIQFDGLYHFDDFVSAMQAPRDHVTLTCRFNEEYLVIQAAIAPKWHLYSVTQPDGGTIRTTFEFESPDLKLQKIHPTANPHVNSNVPGFDVDIEEHDDSITWILTFRDKLPTDKIIKGKLNGQVCQEGEGGMCIPITVPFEAVFDPEQAAKMSTSNLGIFDRFVWTADDKEPAEKSVAVFTPQETVNVGSLWIALLFAFLGGIILNVMPCVLPIIGLKILSFFEQAGKSRSRAFMLNVWYSLGILSVFLFLAFLSLGLSILFTFDLFNIIMACVVFVMALSLMDIWTLSVPGILGGKVSGQLTSQEGILGAFFKGIITTLLAIPCGAPLLSPAVNWADIQIRSGNMPEVFLMYGVIGLGMASPYLLLGAFPELLRFLPKPGEWMETFKKTMGFCLLLAVVWILYFVPLEKLLPTVTLLFALWFVCWLFGEQQLKGGVTPLWRYIIAMVVLGLVIRVSYQVPGFPNSYTLESAMRTRLYGHEGKHWKLYSDSAFESALSSGKTVIVDFTADWCVNCKVLEAQVLQSEAILSLIDEKGIVSLTGDCTRHGEATELLSQLGPFQVPTIAIFNPANPSKPIVLRGFYTQKTLLELLQ